MRQREQGEWLGMPCLLTGEKGGEKSGLKKGEKGEKEEERGRRRREDERMRG